MKAERIFGRMFTLVICIILIITITATTVAAANESLPLYSTARVVNASKLNLRREPQGEIIGKLASGKTVTILSEIDRNGYYHVRVDETGLECYVYGEYLAFESLGNQTTPVVPNFTYEPDEEVSYDEIFSSSEETFYYEGATLVVTSDKKLNLRKKPSRKGYRLKYLYNGELVEIVDPTVKNGYIRVKDISDGTIGYVSIDYVAYDGYVEDVILPSACNCNCQCPGCYCNR